MIIAVDVDGVVANMLPEWLARYNRDYNDNLTAEDITDWDTAKFVKPECGTDIYKYLGDPTLYDDVLPFPDAKTVIDILRIWGHRVIFVTAVADNSAGRKYAWLKEHGFIQDKKDYVEAWDKSLIRADILIDDAPHNVQDFPNLAVLMTRPYNEALDWPYRVDDWLEVWFELTRRRIDKQMLFVKEK